MWKLIAVLFFSLIAFSGFAGATSIQTGQETLEVVIEDGDSRQVFLILITDGGETVSVSGEAAAWIGLGSSSAGDITFPAAGTQHLQLNITIPDGQEIGDYQATLLSDGTVVSTILLTVTLPTEEIESLKTLSQVHESIEDLEASLLTDLDTSLEDQLAQLTKEIETISSELSTSITTVKNYQEELSLLEQEKESLEAQVTALEQHSTVLEEENQNLEITGNLVRTESGILFVVGLIIGAGGIFLFYRKLHK